MVSGKFCAHEHNDSQKLLWVFFDTYSLTTLMSLFYYSGTKLENKPCFLVVMSGMGT